MTIIIKYMNFSLSFDSCEKTEKPATHKVFLAPEEEEIEKP